MVNNATVCFQLTQNLTLTAFVSVNSFKLTSFFSNIILDISVCNIIVLSSCIWAVIANYS